MQQRLTLSILAVLWDDWAIKGTEGVYTQLKPINGHQALIVQRGKVTNKNSGANNPATFQAILFAGSNNILLNYQNVAVGGTGNSQDWIAS